MAESKLPLRKWLFAAYFFFYTARKGISSVQPGKMIGVTQKTAWFLSHRIREAMKDGGLLSGIVEVDETYVGGSDRNRHANKKYTCLLRVPPTAAAARITVAIVPVNS